MAKDDKNGQPKKLGVKQQNAIDLLITGTSDRETAEAIGVARQTVTEWRNHDYEFMAALNRKRADVWGAQTGRLQSLVAKAVDVLESNLDSDDERISQAAAVHLLRCVGLYGSDLTPSRATSAEDIENRTRERELQEQLLRERNESDAQRLEFLDGIRSAAYPR